MLSTRNLIENGSGYRKNRTSSFFFTRRKSSNQIKYPYLPNVKKTDKKNNDVKVVKQVRQAWKRKQNILDAIVASSNWFLWLSPSWCFETGHDKWGEDRKTEGQGRPSLNYTLLLMFWTKICEDHIYNLTCFCSHTSRPLYKSPSFICSLWLH